MTLYLDTKYRPHLSQNGDNTYLAWEDADNFFADKCQAFIEGYRIVPQGHTWVREDGMKFSGLMITPAVNLYELKEAQANYEINELKNAFSILGVNVDE